MIEREYIKEKKLAFKDFEVNTYICEILVKTSKDRSLIMKSRPSDLWWARVIVP